MKAHILYSIAAVTLLSRVASAQDWEMTLNNGDTYLGVTMIELRNDSVQVMTPEWVDWIWLGNIQLVQRKGSAWKSGALVGGLIGFLGGGLYAIESPEKTVDMSAPIRGVVGGLVGAIPGGLIGAFVGGLIDTGARYEFSRMTPDERTAVVREIILD